MSEQIIDRYIGAGGGARGERLTGEIERRRTAETEAAVPGSTRTDLADLAGFNHVKGLDGDVYADLFIEALGRQQFGDAAVRSTYRNGRVRTRSSGSMVAEQTFNTWRTLVAKGLDADQAAAVAGQPGILQRLGSLNKAAEWLQDNQLGRDLRTRPAADAQRLWDSLDKSTQNRLRAQGFAMDMTEGEAFAGGGQTEPGMPTRMGVLGFMDTTAGAIGTGLEWIDQATRGVPSWAIGKALTGMDVAAEQTVQRGYRALEMSVRSGNANWAYHFMHVGDGDDTFRPGTDARLREIAGDDDTTVEFAKALAAGTSPEDLLEGWGYVEGSQEWTQGYMQLQDLIGNEKVQAMVRIADENKLSPGRAMAQLLPGDDRLVSGSVDAVWRLFADPFLIAGKISKGRRFSKALSGSNWEENLHQVQEALGNDFVENIDRWYTGRASIEFADQRLLDIEDAGTYNKGLRSLIRSGDMSPEAAAMVELLDHVYVADGAFLQRYITQRPNMVGLAMSVQKMKNTGKAPTPKDAATALYDHLLTHQIASGVGYTIRREGAFMPRLTTAGTFRAQAKANLTQVRDWSLRTADQRKLEHRLDIDDVTSPEIVVAEYVRRSGVEGLRPTLAEDYTTMRNALIAKGHDPAKVSEVLQGRLFTDLDAGIVAGEVRMESLARLATAQGRYDDDLADKIRGALAVIDDVDIAGPDLVDAFDTSLAFHRRLVDEGLGGDDTMAGLLNDDELGRNVDTLRGMIREAHHNFVQRQRDKTPDLLADRPDRAGYRADGRGRVARAVGGRVAPTDNLPGLDRLLTEIQTGLGKGWSLDELAAHLENNPAGQFDLDTYNELLTGLKTMRDKGYRVDVGTATIRAADPAAYEARMAELAVRALDGEMKGLEEGRAALRAKLLSIENPWQPRQALSSAAARALRPIAKTFTRVPKFGRVDFNDAAGIVELERMLHMGVSSDASRRLVQAFANGKNEGQRRAVLFAAKRTLLEQTGILYNPHAYDFVMSELASTQQFFGSMKWVDTNGMARTSALLPDVHTADAIRIPDYETVMWNVNRSRAAQAFSPMYGEFSPVIKAGMRQFKTAVVFAPRLILRAGGLDESLSFLVRQGGIRNTAQAYGRSWLLRSYASRYRRAVVRNKGRRMGRIVEQRRLASGLDLPAQDWIRVPGTLGPRDSFVANARAHADLQRYRAVEARVEGGEPVSAEEFDEALTALTKHGIDPNAIGAAARGLDEWQERARLSLKLDKPSMRYEPEHLDDFLREADVEGMWDTKIPVAEGTGPYLTDSARWIDRRADSLVNWLGRPLGLEEKHFRAARRMASDPYLQRTLIHDVIQHNMVESVDTRGIPTNPMLAEEQRVALSFDTDRPGWVQGEVLDGDNANAVVRTYQQINASRAANVPIKASLAAVPSGERVRVVHDMNRAGVATREVTPAGFGVDIDFFDEDNLDGLYARPLTYIAELPAEARPFATARAWFSSLPESTKKWVWAYLDDDVDAIARMDWDPLGDQGDVAYGLYRKELGEIHGVQQGSDFPMSRDEHDRLLEYLVDEAPKRDAQVLALDDGFARPVLPTAAHDTLRTAGPRLYFHGSGNQLNEVLPLRDTIAGWGLRQFSGPGLYVTHSAAYGAGYASTSMAATRRGDTVLNQLMVKEAARDRRVIWTGDNDGLRPFDPDAAEAVNAALADWGSGVRAFGGDDAADLADEIAAPVTNMAELRLRWASVHDDPSLLVDDMLEGLINQTMETRFYGTLKERGFSAFSDHDSVWTADTVPTLGATPQGQDRLSLAIFDDDVIEPVGPANWSAAREGAEYATAGILNESMEDWAAMLAGGDWGVDITHDMVARLWRRDLLSAENMRNLSKHDKFTPANHVYDMPTEDEMVLWVPRRVHTRGITAGSEPEYVLNRATAAVDPALGEIVGTPDPRMARELLKRYEDAETTKGLWHLVEVRVKRADLQGRTGTTLGKGRRLMSEDHFHAGAPWPVGRDLLPVELPAGLGDDTVEFFPLTADELAGGNINPTDLPIDPAAYVHTQLPVVRSDLTRRLQDHIETIAAGSGVDEGRLLADGGYLLDTVVNHSHILDDLPEDLAREFATMVVLADAADNLRYGNVDIDDLLDVEGFRSTMRGYDAGTFEHLFDGTDDLRPDWLRFDPGGKGAWKAPRGKSIERAVDDFMEDAIPQLRQLTAGPGGMPAAQLVGPASRGRFRAEQVADLEIGDMPELVLKQNLKERFPLSDAHGTNAVVDLLRRTRDTGFDLITLGIAEMSRTPQFFEYFSNALGDARRFRRTTKAHAAATEKYEALFGANYEDMIASLDVELGFASTTMDTKMQLANLDGTVIQNFAGHFGVRLDGDRIEEFRAFAAAELAHMNAETAQATTAALRKLTSYIDDSRVRSQFADTFDVIWPFHYATEHFVTRWLNTAQNSPEMFRRMQLYYLGFYNSGVITKDEQGNDVYEIPMSGAVTKGIAWLLQPLGADPSMVPGVNFTGRLDQTFAGVTDFGRLSAGPVVSLPLSVLRPLQPELVGGFEEALLGEFGRGKDPLENLLPSTITRFAGLFNRDIDGSNAIGAMMYVEAEFPELVPGNQRDEQGNLRPPTSEDIERYYEKVRWATKSLGAARGLVGLFAPVSPNEEFDPHGYAETFFGYLENGVTYAEAEAAFLADFPDAASYMMTLTDTPAGSPVEASRNTLAHLEANPEFYDTYNNAGPWLLPHSGGDDDFDRAAWADLVAMGYKKYKGGEDWYEDFKYAKGAAIYFPLQRKKEALLATAATQEDKAHIRDTWRQWKENFFAYNPMFQAALERREGVERRRRVRTEMANALADPLTPPVTQLDAIRDLHHHWDRLSTLTRQVDTYSADERRGFQRMFHEWALQRTAGDFMATAYYERMMQHDLDLPEVFE